MLARLLRLGILPALLFPLNAWAIAGLEEAIADFMVWVVILFVPALAIYLFWKVHVLPEVFAEKHQHPNKHGIQVLCLLSLAFGGLLWPLAWLWAFTKPVAHKLAYGTDKHDDYFLKPGSIHEGKPLELAIVDDELLMLKEKLESLSRKRALIASKETPAQIAAEATAKEEKEEGAGHA